MKFFIVFFLFVSHSYTQTLNQKIVLCALLDTQKAQKVLAETKQYFSAHPHIDTFLSQHNLVPNLEKLDPYILITLSSIQNIKEKQEIFYLLHKKFSDMFTINNTFSTILPLKIATLEKTKAEYTDKINKKEKVSTAIKTISKVTPRQTTFNSLQNFWKNLDNEWIGLLILALAGFLLIFRSTRQISKIKNLQNEVEQYQNKVGNEMKNMETKDA